MKFLKFSTKTKGLAITGVIILIILSLNFCSGWVRNLFYLGFSPAQGVLWQVGKGISQFGKSILELNELRKQNKELSHQNQQFMADRLKLEILEEENETLRKALNMGPRQDIKVKLARVLAKDSSQDYILINKGLKDGLADDMPVITSQRVVVGKISRAYKNFSKVMLISNKACSISAQLKEIELPEVQPQKSTPSNANNEGIVRGKGAFSLKFELVSHHKKLVQGQLLVTTLLGGIFPEGLLLGRIEKVTSQPTEPFQEATILPLFDLSQLENVFVIVGF